MSDLTKETIINWSPEELRKQMLNPETRAEIERVWNAPDVDPGEAAAAALEETERLAAEAAANVVPVEQPDEAAEAARVEAERQAAQQIAQDVARAEKLRIAGITVESDANGRVIRILQKYQAKDDRGNPIGEPTFFEVTSWEDLAIKQQAAHENATRYADRMKRKAERRPPVQRTDAPPQIMTDEEIAAAIAESKAEDPKVAAAAIRKIALDEERVQLQTAQANADAAIKCANWARKHIFEFNPCNANATLITDYIVGNNLDWSEESLDAAFEEVQSRLAPVVLPERFSAPPANTLPAPAPVAAAVPAVVPPVPAPAVPTAPAPAPAAPPASTIPPAVVPRPGVNGSLVPGQNSGVRPNASTPKGLTKAEIHSWTPEQMKKEMKKPGRRAEIERVYNSK